METYRKVVLTIFGSFVGRAVLYGGLFGLTQFFFTDTGNDVFSHIVGTLFGAIFFGIIMAFASKRYMDAITKNGLRDSSYVQLKKYRKYLRDGYIPESQKERQEYSIYLDNLEKIYIRTSATSGARRVTIIVSYVFIGILFVTSLIVGIGFPSLIFPLVALVGIGGILLQRSTIKKIRQIRTELHATN